MTGGEFDGERGARVAITLASRSLTRDAASGLISVGVVSCNTCLDTSSISKAVKYRTGMKKVIVPRRVADLFRPSTPQDHTGTPLVPAPALAKSRDTVAG
jgi:hypothetical protein